MLMYLVDYGTQDGSMAKHPKIFSKLHEAMVYAREQQSDKHIRWAVVREYVRLDDEWHHIRHCSIYAKWVGPGMYDYDKVVETWYEES